LPCELHMSQLSMQVASRDFYVAIMCIRRALKDTCSLPRQVRAHQSPSHACALRVQRQEGVQTQRLIFLSVALSVGLWVTLPVSLLAVSADTLCTRREGLATQGGTIHLRQAHALARPSPSLQIQDRTAVSALCAGGIAKMYVSALHPVLATLSRSGKTRVFHDTISLP
jgi:hypothetical protein